MLRRSDERLRAAFRGLAYPSAKRSELRLLSAGCAASRTPCPPSSYDDSARTYVRLAGHLLSHLATYSDALGARLNMFEDGGLGGHF